MTRPTAAATDPSGPPPPDADGLSRVVKMALDTGEVDTLEAGYALFRTYRLGVIVGPEAADSAAHQAAVLTIVNTARRAMLGGVVVSGHLDVPLRVQVPPYATFAAAVAGLGGRTEPWVPEDVPVLTVGSVRDVPERSPIALAVTFDGWRGGVVPVSDNRRLREADTVTPAAVLAAAVGVSEVFQHVRGYPVAGHRPVGLSLWAPEELSWEGAPDGPTGVVLPSRLWLIGLGHLGQAYLWTLGLLPYRAPGEVELVLQDFDRLTLSNDSTSLLTRKGLVGERKTRAMAAWAEARGFSTRLVERVYPGGIRVADDEPQLALGGVDNPQARAAYEDAGFGRVIEAGLGAGPTEYLAMRLHSFPASTSARRKWGGQTAGADAAPARAPAYDRLAAGGADECGLVRMASRTVGAPFVGAAAAALVVAEVLRLLNGGPLVEVLDMTLRDPGCRSVVPATARHAAWNPGYTC